MSDNHLIPASIMRQMGMPKRDNREQIINYLVSQEGSVTLSPLQQELLRRWHAADDLMRSLRYSSREVAELLKKKFVDEDGKGYSIATAWRDMEDAQYVFGTTRKPNKKYSIALHQDRIEAAIVIAQKQGKRDLLPKLFDCMMKAILAMPDEKEKNPLPTAIVFQFTQNNFDAAGGDEMTPARAQDIAIERLKKLGVDIEDIMHEDIEE